MYREQTWLHVKELRAKGWPVAKIARVCGMSRNTVYRLIKLNEPPRYARERIELSARQQRALDMFAKALIDQAFEKLRTESRVQI